MKKISTFLPDVYFLRTKKALLILEMVQVQKVKKYMKLNSV